MKKGCERTTDTPGDGSRGVKRGKYLSQCLLRGAAFYECIVWEVMDGNLQTLLILMLDGFCVWVCVCAHVWAHLLVCGS